MTYEKPPLGEFKAMPADDELHYVTGVHVGPFLRIHPHARLYVKIGHQLVPVTDVFYDNERDIHIIETPTRGYEDFIAYIQDQLDAATEEGLTRIIGQRPNRGEQ